MKKKPVSSRAASGKSSGRSQSSKAASAKSVTSAKTVTSRRLAAEPAVVTPEADAPQAARKKGVRKATLTTGIRTKKPTKQLGRSRIPIDAPLDVVFQNDLQAREAFAFLGVHTIRDLEKFHPDDLVMRLTSPAKQTVGRIRKILAMNNRCLEGDEAFALEYQESLNPGHS